MALVFNKTGMCSSCSFNGVPLTVVGVSERGTNTVQLCLVCANLVNGLPGDGGKPLTTRDAAFIANLILSSFGARSDDLVNLVSGDYTLVKR